MNKQSERDEVLKNGLIGTYAGTRISGKSYDPDGKEIEEVHEADCYCCRKDLFNPQPETQTVSVEEEFNFQALKEYWGLHVTCTLCNLPT